MHALAYEQHTELEARHWWFRGRRAVCTGLLRDELAGEAPKRVLDLGAGSGGFLAELRALGAQVVYTDLDAGVLAACRERGFPNGVRARGEGLPFRDASFDLVCLFDVLEHIADDVHALREVRRVLRPGGHVCLHVPAHPFLFARNDEVAGHERRYTRRSLDRALQSAGFTARRNGHTNMLLFPLIAPVVLAMKAADKLRLTPRGDYTNLSWDPPAVVHEALYRLFAMERFLSRRVDLPVGHSIVALYRPA